VDLFFDSQTARNAEKTPSSVLARRFGVDERSRKRANYGEFTVHLGLSRLITPYHSNKINDRFPSPSFSDRRFLVVPNQG
jgi:hypothetical protein